MTQQPFIHYLKVCWFQFYSIYSHCLKKGSA